MYVEMIVSIVVFLLIVKLSHILQDSLEKKRRCSYCKYGRKLFLFDDGWCSFWNNNFNTITNTAEDCIHYKRRFWKFWRSK